MLDIWRTALTALGLVALGVNAGLAVMVLRYHLTSIVTSVWFAYAVATAGTSAIAAYWRLKDGFYAAPLNVGDFTALVPMAGGLTAGLIAWRALGRKVAEHKLIETGLKK